MSRIKRSSVQQRIEKCKSTLTFFNNKFNINYLVRNKAYLSIPDEAQKSYPEWKFLLQLSAKIRSSIAEHLSFNVKHCSYLLRPEIDTELAALLKCASDLEGKVCHGFKPPNLLHCNDIFKDYSFGDTAYNALCGFDYNVETANDRECIFFNFPEPFDKSTIKFPKGATHFKTFATATRVPNFGHLDVNFEIPQIHTDSCTSDDLLEHLVQIDEDFEEESLGIFVDEVISDDDAFILCVGIEFYKITRDKAITKKKWVAMKVLEIV